MSPWLVAIVAFWSACCVAGIGYELRMVRIGRERLASVYRQRKEMTPALFIAREYRAIRFVRGHWTRVAAKVLLLLAGTAPVFAARWGPWGGRGALYLGLLGAVVLLTTESYLSYRLQTKLEEFARERRLRHSRARDEGLDVAG